MRKKMGPFSLIHTTHRYDCSWYGKFGLVFDKSFAKAL